MNASIDITNALPFLLGASGGGIAVFLLAQAIKKAFGLSSGHVIHLMVVAVSIIIAAAQYLLQLKNLPVEVLGISSTTVYGVSQFVYNEAPRIMDLLKRIQLADPQNVPLQPITGATPTVDAATAEPEAAAAPVAQPEAQPATANGEFNG